MEPVLVVHGGAGVIADGGVTERLAGCRRAAVAGWAILRAGGAALDAVQRAVEVLEDDPLFNAGTGSVLNAEGRIQQDASIMDGARLAAGAVANVTRFPHPIRVARQVLEDGRHLLLVGEGAQRFAHQAGIEECAEETLIVAARRRQWETAHGTVGCVAVDARGGSAAATSTGGLFDALPGRVGDSPLIGCGTYACDAGAVSCTGLGEAIIRVTLARAAVELLQAGHPPQGAASRAIALLAERTGGQAGLIVVDRHGRAGHAHNAGHMPVCVVATGAEPIVDA